MSRIWKNMSNEDVRRWAEAIENTSFHKYSRRDWAQFGRKLASRLVQALAEVERLEKLIEENKNV